MRPHIKKALTQNQLKTTHLQLTDGRLNEFPYEILNFKNLKHLNLLKNNISKIPESIYKLNSLEHLNLNSNRFTQFPSIAFLLPKLESLSLSGNKIVNISDKKYAEILRIKKVDLSFNNISSYPKTDLTIEPLIEEISFRGNTFTKFPEALKRAYKLKILNLSENNIDSLPDDLFDNLVDLEELDLSYNRIKFLPESIGKLSKLKSLNVAGNKIQYLPNEVVNLTQLKSLILSGNPIEKAPLEIVSQGSQSVINYYLSLGDSVSLHEAKLLIVGHGNVGKTFLMNRLIYGETPSTNTTEGIFIEKWSTNTPSNPDFRINIWDFGGQEIYHSTHQFFLTKRSLYLFVWEARTDQHIISFDYWLNVIRLLSNESPIIVVLNKIDERITSIDERSLKEKFQNIDSFFQVSAKNGTNIEFLTDKIKNIIENLPLIGDKLPRVWVDIREELEHLTVNYISIEEYLIICNKHGLSNKKALFLSQYFHDLGVFLHFQEDFLLRNIVFLKPEWATNAVYKIIDSKEIILNYGEFHFNQLSDILIEYPEDKHPYLIELMKKFELCLEIDKTRFLIPELLNPIKAEFEWNHEDSLRFEYHYDFMPAGILARLSVRNNIMVDKNAFWKSGVIFKRETSKALVICDYFSKKISISTVGPRKSLLLEIIKKEIEYINFTQNNVDVLEKIPCICSTCQKSPKPHLFNYHFVRKIAADNTFRTIPCELSASGVNVSRLIGLYSIQEQTSNFEQPQDADALLNDLIEISSRLLERKHTFFGENNINDNLTDHLRSKGYNISDQTRSGVSGLLQRDSGELDLMVRNKNGMPISIIECFRIESCGPNNTIVASHIEKLLKNYDTNGLFRNFVVIYCEGKNYSKLWDNYVSYINKMESGSEPSDYVFLHFKRRPELSIGVNINIGVSHYERQGESVELFHVFLNFNKHIKSHTGS